MLLKKLSVSSDKLDPEGGAYIFLSLYFLLQTQVS